MKPSVSVHERFEATDPPYDVKSVIRHFSVGVQQSDRLFCTENTAMGYTVAYLDSAPDQLDYIEYPMRVEDSSHVLDLEFDFYQSRDDSDDFLFDIKCHKRLDEVDGLFGYGPLIEEVELCYELSSEIFLNVIDEMYKPKNLNA